MNTALSMARDERSELAELLATLSPEQWDAPSLCDEWTVKDVVAHMISYDDLGLFATLKRFAKGRLVRANQVGVEEYRDLSVRELLQAFNSRLEPRGLTARLGGMIGLVDGTIHHQDIRRALGIPRDVPPEHISTILPSLPSNPRLGVGKRVRGLRLQATDVDWTHGDGAAVMGTGEAIMMAITGRPAVLDELVGPGVSILAERIR
jgi:uncharacterized protein (TIGR03083 family)